MKISHTILLFILTISHSISVMGADESNITDSASSLLQRLLPNDRVDEFRVELIEPVEEKDVFEVETVEGKLTIRGNNGVAIASGLNWYLTNHCNSQISMNFSMIKLPSPLPKVKKVRVVTPLEHRYMFNYCTYGYSMPWWDWDRWEDKIDYMACMGVNMPLATIGQEAVWQKVYKELGMTDKQLDEFFVGPAHLPWGWMGNIDGLGGPLPQGWIDQRAELQKKILKRMRELGMKPVLQGFTGHVPEHLKKIFPKADIVKIHSWAGIPGTMFLDPADPLFAKIGTMFIRKQTEMFGTDHFYDADCFIEVDPPSSDPEYLAKVSKGVYESMTAADPEAVWVMQGWFFFFRSEFWKPEQGKAFLSGVPKDKLIMLDLYGEKNEVWDKTDAFYGQPWIWNVICNEDQKVNMSGDLEVMQKNFSNAWKSEGKKNLRGIGTIPEGIGYNNVVQDFVYGKAWNQKDVDIDEWITQYAERRFNTRNKAAGKAWRLMKDSVYGRTRTDWNPLIITPQLQIFEPTKEDIRLVRKSIRITAKNPLGIDFDASKLFEASAALLEMEDELKNVPSWRFDVVNVHRELLSNLSYVMIDDLTKSYLSGDVERFKKSGENMLGLIDDLERITGTNEHFMLASWVKDARSWGKTDEEKNYYEWNARTIVSIWQPWKEGGLRDYAGKQWNGMFSGYYRPRWKLLIDQLTETMVKGGKFDPHVYDKAVREIDYKWTHSQGGYQSEPKGDPGAEARRLRKKYQKHFVSEAAPAPIPDENK